MQQILPDLVLLKNLPLLQFLLIITQSWKRMGVMYFKTSKRIAAGNSGFSKEFESISTAPYIAGPGLKLHLLVDASSVELFVDGGRLVMTTLVFPDRKVHQAKTVFKGWQCSVKQCGISWSRKNLALKKEWSNIY
jgi:sucrose-6-phosphate hydrolase SacC (GH32 family)